MTPLWFWEDEAPPFTQWFIRYLEILALMKTELS